MSCHFDKSIESLVNDHMRMNNHINMVYLHHSSPSDLSFIMVDVYPLLHLLSLCNNCVSFIQQIVLSTEITMYNIYCQHTSFPFSKLIFHPFQIINYGVRYLKNGRVTKNRNFKNERVEVRGRLPLE